MSNEFGDIQHEGWVTYKIKMLNCWDVSVVITPVGVLY